ncbi:ubiquitin-like activating enzyme 2 [Bombus vancouverensis nearcticus]|uniref:SUMO-activating enzyme subunit n=1 Tax=Bombus bifarius TaxID=103933 RepID=A0A6P8LVE9_9HYME|nr:SUMO-activating enzyme subunit 2 [Bombus vancouverensis nearcticus]XP_033299408.1 SUMO-activating enzyme subunit 2 [Bombus bifarius]
MAANINGVFTENLQNAILQSKVLIVGAGGIGCEILKNLVMTGFVNIDIIDLDTIDVSNLNRQFLFQKKHVGKSKADVARETALTFNPDAKIVHYHDSITSSDYGVSFFKKFTLVMNALDNRAARNHVNRMCLAADVPLIESGTAGYEGQVELIKKGLSQCYECTPKAAQKTFPGCTIRNTPSEPIHCIVWAKHLFNQLFGEEDPDQDVSPDTADPEASDSAGQGALNSESNEKGNVDRISTKVWAQSCNYDSEKLFTKLFHDDIKYLLSMDNLWKKRRPPIPLSWKELPDGVPGCSKEVNEPGLKDQQRWSISKCGAVFAESIKNLSSNLKNLQEKSPNNHLVWDKDDQSSMDFVAACANIRAYIFGIPQKTRFDIKSMAGNIIPAIATTNAIVAGLVVLHAFRILENNLKACKSVYLRSKMNHRNQLLVPEKNVNPPNPKCYVCAPTPQAILEIDTSKTTIKELDEVVLKNRLNMIAPDVIIDGTGTVVISSEEGETEDNNNKFLEELGIKDGTILKIDDFQQNYSLTVTIVYRERPSLKGDSPDFVILAKEQDLKPKEDNDLVKPSTSNGQVETSDDNVMLAKTEAVSSDMAKKRKTATPDENVSSKKRKLEVNDVDDDISIIESDINNDTDKAKSNFKIHKNSEDDDCLIVHDDNIQIAATTQ